MRISDWSSDVCSSDLDNQHRKLCPLPPHRAWRGSGRARGRKARSLAVYHPASCSFAKNILRPRPFQVYRIDLFMGSTVGWTPQVYRREKPAAATGPDDRLPTTLPPSLGFPLTIGW